MLTFIALCFAGIKDDDDDTKKESFKKQCLTDTFMVYQYDSYELKGDSVAVGPYIQTHRFVFTKKDVTYSILLDTKVQASVTKEYKDPKSNWEAILRDFKNIEFRDIKLVWYIDWKNFENNRYLGFTYNTDFYSYKFYKDELTALTLPLYNSNVNLTIPTKNTYTIYNIQGKELYKGTDLTSIQNIKVDQFGTGIFFVNITGLNFNKNIRLQSK